MKKEYTKPEILVENVKIDDVICESGTFGERDVHETVVEIKY